MIFVGDIALPPGIKPLLSYLPWAPSSPVIANLEGGISCDTQVTTRSNKVFNDASVIDYLKEMNVKVVSLANNHLCDISTSPQYTMDLLSRNEILFCGAGEDSKHAARPAYFREDGQEYLVFSFGWHVIDCECARDSKPGVNRLTDQHVFDSIAKGKELHPEASIILFLHWDYELEVYPMPMHRQLAHQAIERGADAVIGTHPHCVQGIEIFRGAPIVYSLGNWLFPHGIFINGKLSFPEYALRQLAFEWKPKSKEMICHWFDYDRINNQINFISSERAAESELVNKLTPFMGFSHTQYVDWFRKNRKKRLLLPVYKSSESRVSNLFRDWWVMLRGYLIHLLVKLNSKHKIKELWTS